jgi:hypothetical protein
MATAKSENVGTLADLIDRLYQEQAPPAKKPAAPAEPAARVSDTVIAGALAGAQQALTGLQQRLAASAQGQAEAADKTLSILKLKRVRELAAGDPVIAARVEALTAEAKLAKADAEALAEWEPQVRQQIEHDLEQLTRLAGQVARRVPGGAAKPAPESPAKPSRAAPKRAKARTGSSSKSRASNSTEIGLAYTVKVLEGCLKQRRNEAPIVVVA